MPVVGASQKVVLWQHMYAAVGIFDDDYYKITTQSHGKEFWKSFNNWQSYGQVYSDTL